ncbi:MAG: amidohydrolase family protein [Anaerolineae bacterium]
MTQAVDTFIHAGAIITMNSEFELIHDGIIAIQAEKIVAIGPAAEVQEKFTASETIDCTTQAVMPGLINCHTHAPMTLLRGLNDDLRLDVWLGYLMPLENEFVTPEFVSLGTKLACAEMIRSGITAFADMYFFESHIAKTTAEAGMRALLGQSVIMFPTSDSKSWQAGIELCRNFIQEYAGHPLIQPAVSPHAWYTATPELLQACAKLALEYDVPVHTHISETLLEVENCREQHDMSPVLWNKKNGILDTKLLAAHCCHIDRADMREFKAAGSGISHNPTSNLKLACGIAPVAEMLEVGCNVGIGTDGPASNNDLDMFEEVRLAALLAKVVRHDPTDLPAKQALELATIGGAKALHMGDKTGSLEVGKLADLIVIDMNNVHNWPHFNNNPESIYSRIVYTAKSTDVKHVMVNGRWLMQDRNLLTINEQEAMAQAAEVALEIDAFVQKRESSPYNKLIALEQVAREEGYETQVKIPLESPDLIIEKIESGAFTITKQNSYRQFDHYFIFDTDDENAARLRFREDHYLDAKGNVAQSRTRLTLLGKTHPEAFSNSVMLSRTRFMAPATRSLRFYREYFTPDQEIEVDKLRKRWRIEYEGTDIAINLDQVKNPDIPGWFLEIKARTWSNEDAVHKANLIGQILETFGLSDSDAIRLEYVELAQKALS